MEESIRLGELAGFLPPQANTRAELAVVYGELGAVERGLEMARLALRIAETQNPAQIGHDLGVLARLQLFNGYITEAQLSVEKAKDDPYGASWPVFFCVAALAEAELVLEDGELERALAVLDALVTELRGYGMRLHVAQALFLRAGFAQHEAGPGRARSLPGSACRGRGDQLEADPVAHPVRSQRAGGGSDRG